MFYKNYRTQKLVESERKRKSKSSRKGACKEYPFRLNDFTDIFFELGLNQKLCDKYFYIKNKLLLKVIGSKKANNI